MSIKCQGATCQGDLQARKGELDVLKLAFLSPFCYRTLG